MISRRARWFISPLAAGLPLYFAAASLTAQADPGFDPTPPHAKRVCQKTIPWPAPVLDSAGDLDLARVKALAPTDLKANYHHIRFLNIGYEYYLRHPVQPASDGPHERQATNVVTAMDLVAKDRRQPSNPRSRDAVYALMRDPKVSPDLPEHLRLYAARLGLGTDPLQAELWAAYGYALNLGLNARYPEVVRLAPDIVRDKRYRSVALSPRIIEEGEASTYYSPQTLLLALRLLYFYSAASLDIDERGIMQLFVTYESLSLAESDPARRAARDSIPDGEQRIMNQVRRLARKLSSINDGDRPAYLNGSQEYEVTPRYVDIVFPFTPTGTFGLIHYDRVGDKTQVFAEASLVSDRDTHRHPHAHPHSCRPDERLCPDGSCKKECTPSQN